MPMLTIMPQRRTIEVAEGVSVLEALLGAQESIMHKCEGKAKCGSCHIFVHEGRKSLSKIQPLENERLDSVVGVGAKSRLACQARLGSENVTIELLGFASGL
jgi:2Fe-2S ferredoxin